MQTFFSEVELPAVVITAVYIPPDANVNTALALLLNAINIHQPAHPNGVHIIAGDFNKANLKTVLPKFHQYVKCPTRGDNNLDHVYSNIKHAYRAVPLPHLGRSDHLSLLLTPAYTPLNRQTKPAKSPPGPRTPSPDCRTASNTHSGMPFTMKTWQHSQTQYCLTQYFLLPALNSAVC